MSGEALARAAGQMKRQQEDPRWRAVGDLLVAVESRGLPEGDRIHVAAQHAALVWMGLEDEE